MNDAPRGKRGGKRPGAGRPPVTGIVTVQLRLQRTTVRALARATRGHPLGSKSRVADAAIRVYLAQHTKPVEQANRD